MKYPKIREVKEAIRSLVTPAYTTQFPKVPHTPFEKFRGKPVVDDENCVGCETCANVCPPGAITCIDEPQEKTRVISRNYGMCIFCGQCEEHCITGKGVVLSDTQYDLSAFNRKQLVEEQEKELILCEWCNAVITTREHIIFIHHVLGPKAFSSVLNLNMLNERLKLVDPDSIKIEVIDHLKRKDMFNVMCPDCLRQTLVKDLL
ncbi:MAG: 4Fe-4S binding protein [Bacteroidales bacterium]|nr:4Fe-4S binding protein [Bacteroidales bacterium]